MSTTFHLECDSCQESIWIGQRSHGRSYLYFDDADLMNLFNQFIFRHQTNMVEDHHLAFRSDGVSKFMNGNGWTEVETSD